MSSGSQDHIVRYGQCKDAESFAAIVDQYQSMVYATCMRRLRNRDDADDVTQEVFLSLAKHASQISSGNLGGWLHRCTVNAANSLLRSNLARRSREKSAAVAGGGRDEVAEWRQIEEVLDGCLAELSTEDRELLIERYFANRSQSELAEALGVDQATISRRLKKAIEQLRQQMANKGVCLTAAVVATTLTEHAFAYSVPSSVSAGLMKIGVAGVGDTSAQGSLATLIPGSWPVIAIAISSVVVVAALLVRLFVEGGDLPTSAVAALASPPSSTLVTELPRLDYSKERSFSDVSMDDRSHVALCSDFLDRRHGLYVFGKKQVKRLLWLPTHGRCSLSLGSKWLVAVNFNGEVRAVDDQSSRLLTESADIECPPSMNQHGWIAFVERSPSNRIRLSFGNETQTVVEADGQFTDFDQVGVNNEGLIAFSAETARGKSGIFISTGDGDSTAVAVTGDQFASFRSGFDLNNRGQLAFVAQLADGSDAVCLGDAAGLKQVARSGDYFSSILQVSVNDAGMVAFTARRPADPSDQPIAGLYLWDGAKVLEVLAGGQSIGGKPLEGVLVWRDSLNNAGHLAVLADFGPGQLSSILRLELPNAD